MSSWLFFCSLVLAVSAAPSGVPLGKRVNIARIYHTRSACLRHHAAPLYDANSEYVPNEYIVVFRPELDPGLGAWCSSILCVLYKSFTCGENGTIWLRCNVSTFSPLLPRPFFATAAEASINNLLRSRSNGTGAIRIMDRFRIGSFGGFSAYLDDQWVGLCIVCLE